VRDVLPARPQVASVPCPSCGAPVDPLRAPRIMLLEDGFRFLCSDACRDRYAERQAPPREPAPELAPRRDSTVTRRFSVTPRPSDEAHGAAGGHELVKHLYAPLGIAALALVLGLGAIFLDDLVAVVGAFVVLAALAHGAQTRASEREVGLLPWLLGPLGVATAGVATVLEGLTAEPAVYVAPVSGLAAVIVIVRSLLDLRATEPVRARVAALAARVPALDEDEGKALRSGDELSVGADDVVPVDGTVMSGSALVLTHPTASNPRKIGPGDPVLAGAQLIDGELHLTTSRVGLDRALVRPRTFLAAPSHAEFGRTDLAGRAGRFVALGALIVSAVLIFVAPSISRGLLLAGAVLIAVPVMGFARGLRLPWIVAIASSAERGIVWPSVRLLDVAGRSNVVGLWTRGTVTEGQPQVVDVTSIGEADSSVIALVAGAEAGAEPDPIATAIRRYALAHRIEAEPVRRLTRHPGRGIVAVAASGETLVVGNRQLLLEEGVSVAVAEAEARRIEDRGHSVVFVSLGGKVRAVISLQDPVRPGARAAVQRLFDLRKEVVLLSGDHRHTVETLGRLVDVTHVRAELAPDERAQAIERLEGIVSVVARPAHNDDVLGAADVALHLGGVSAPFGEQTVGIVSEDVRDAASAMWLAKGARDGVMRALVACVIVAALAVSLAFLGFFEPATAAVVGLLADAYALPAGARLLRRVELRIPVLE
jgi:P-type E1-E2 ATPase